jgi:hypothetical protein
MALTAEREAYLRLAAHSMERSEQIAPHFNIRSPKAYGGYVVSINKNFFIFYKLNRLIERNANILTRVILIRRLSVSLSFISFFHSVCSILYSAGAFVEMLLFD